MVLTMKFRIVLSSEIPGKFETVVLEKDEKNKFD
jgi:hypothetical protein